MRFGISATSLIVPKNFLTRLRPVNVCAIFSLSIRFRRAARAPLQTAAFHRDHQDRRRGRPFLCDSGLTRTAIRFTSHRDQSWPVHDAGSSAYPVPLSPVPGFPGAAREFRYLQWPGLNPSLNLLRSSDLALLAEEFAKTSTAYLSSTFAPTFSSVVLILLASSLGTPSLMVFGAPSTRSLASFRPSPVSARTSLMTSIFFSPVLASTTVKSVFSSAAAAAPPPAAGPAATATATAAETP